MRQQFVPPDLAVRSLETFGLEDRLLLLQEEAGELGVAISHFRRGRCGAWQEVMEELADVLVVAEQVCACQGLAEDVAGAGARQSGQAGKPAGTGIYLDISR